MARYGSDLGEMRPGGHRMPSGHHLDFNAGYEGLENDPGRRFTSERGGMSPRGEPIGFERGPGRGYDRTMRGGEVTFRGYPDVRGYPRSFGQGRPLFAEAHGYDRDFGSGRGGWSNQRQHARGFIHEYDRGYRQPLGRGRERGMGRDW